MPHHYYTIPFVRQLLKGVEKELLAKCEIRHSKFHDSYQITVTRHADFSTLFQSDRFSDVEGAVQQLHCWMLSWVDEFCDQTKADSLLQRPAE